MNRIMANQEQDPVDPVILSGLKFHTRDQRSAQKSFTAEAQRAQRDLGFLSEGRRPQTKIICSREARDRKSAQPLAAGAASLIQDETPAPNRSWFDALRYLRTGYTMNVRPEVSKGERGAGFIQEIRHPQHLATDVFAAACSFGGFAVPPCFSRYSQARSISSARISATLRLR